MNDSVVAARGLVDASLRLAERTGMDLAKRLRARRDRARLGRPPARLGGSLRDGHSSGWTGVACTFALSTGRAGSRTLSALWNTHPSMAAYHEPLPRLVEASADAWAEGGTDDRWRALVLAARDDFVADAWRRGLVYAETNNRLTPLAPALAAAFPDATFVHLWRHPYDFVRSGMRRRYYQGHSWDFARFRPRPDDPIAERWEGAEPVERVAWLWAATNRFIMDWSESREQGVTVISSEALFACDPSTVRAAFSAVGVEPPPARRVQQVLSSGFGAQSRGDFPSARDWTPGLRRSVDAHVGEVAARLGLSL